MNRRAFLQTAAAPALLAGRPADAPVNVVSIVCDQMRGDAMSFLGHPNARTPNLDRMASEGVVFDRCFVNNPVCIPSRKSCFSGLYPHQHGSLTNSQRPLLSYSDTLVEHFERKGYRTGWVGKNHTYESEAMDRLAFKSVRSREPFRAYNGFVPPHWHGDVYWPEEKCYPRINSDRAVDFLESAKAREPFFLHVSYFDPHPPYMAPADYTSRYRSDQMALPDYVPADALSPRLEEFKRAFGMDRATPAELTETMRYYYAQIEWGVDKQVGRLLGALDRLGLSENTVVLFTSDHGDFMGTNGLVRKGMFLYDSLLHVPMIWRAPGRLPAGVRSKAMAQHIDIFPTLVDFSGGRPPDRLPGRSLRPLLETSERDPSDREVFTSAGYGELSEATKNLPLDPRDKNAVPRHTQVLQESMNPEHRCAMIRTAEWKLVRNESRGPELYHMNGGVVEKTNVADRREHSGVRRDLERKLAAWWRW